MISINKITMRINNNIIYFALININSIY